MEKQVYEWYIKEHAVNKNDITSKEIKAKAKEFCSVDNFNASKGWLEKFKKKYCIDLRRAKRTTKNK